MKLNPGDKVGIISPSSFLRNREAVELGLDYLRSLELEPVLGEHVFDAFRYMVEGACFTSFWKAGLACSNSPFRKSCLACAKLCAAALPAQHKVNKPMIYFLYIVSL